MDMVLIISITSVSAVVLGTLFLIKRKKTLSAGSQSPIHPVEPPQSIATSQPTVSEVSGLETKLEKTRGSLFGKLSQFLSRSNSSGLSGQEWDEIEEILLGADIGLGTSQTLLNSAKDKLSQDPELKLKEALYDVSLNIFSDLKRGPFETSSDIKPLVISVVGINGAGKTTTV
ncbi:MAG: signal recognition particle receptor subunit alpha, partial [Deltaproteobacteria bacterium]